MAPGDHRSTDNRMRSADHLLISVGIGLLLAIVVEPSPPTWSVVAVAGVVGVAIDLDHFVIARYNSGSWAAVHRCLRDPRIVVLDQAAIFDAGEVGAFQRLLTHHLVGAGLVGATAVLRPGYGVVVGVVLFGHVVADLVSDVRRHGRR